jgi:hypothetical protein
MKARVSKLLEVEDPFETAKRILFIQARASHSSQTNDEAKSARERLHANAIHAASARLRSTQPPSS